RGRRWVQRKTNKAYRIDRRNPEHVRSLLLYTRTSATSKGGTKGEMRRDKASQDPQHEAGVPIKRAIRPVLRQPEPPGKQRSAYYIPPPTACSVTIINLHATPNPLLRLPVRRYARCGTAEWGEGGNNSFVGGIRTVEEEDAEDEKRENANGLDPELTNAKELSGISHLISRATRLRDSLVREFPARKSAEE
ncbi:hypothetical protein ALC60_12632, partial [Trachymyrmex zeteki]